MLLWIFAGHGVGKEFHEDPVIGHVGRAGSGMVLAPGMVFTIEPMINVGDYHLYIDEDNGWTSYTEDGSLSASGSIPSWSQNMVLKY